MRSELSAALEAPLKALFVAVGYPFRVQKEGLKLRKRASAEIGFNGAYRMKLGSESMKFRRESSKRQEDLEHARVVSVRWSMDSY